MAGLSMSALQVSPTTNPKRMRKSHDSAGTFKDHNNIVHLLFLILHSSNECCQPQNDPNTSRALDAMPSSKLHLSSVPVNAHANCRCKIRRVDIKNMTINYIFCYFHVKGDWSPKRNRSRSGSLPHFNFEDIVAATFRWHWKQWTKHEGKIEK